MHIHIYVCMCTHTYIHVCTYTDTCAYTHTYMCACTYTHAYTYRYMCVYTYTRMRVYTYIHIRTHIYTYTTMSHTGLQACWVCAWGCLSTEMHGFPCEHTRIWGCKGEHLAVCLLFRVYMWKEGVGGGCREF